MKVHHAGQRSGEAHAIGDGAVTMQPHHLVLLRHVVQVTGREDYFIVEDVSFVVMHCPNGFNKAGESIRYSLILM